MNLPVERLIITIALHHEGFLAIALNSSTQELIDAEGIQIKVPVETAIESDL